MVVTFFPLMIGLLMVNFIYSFLVLFLKYFVLITDKGYLGIVNSSEYYLNYLFQEKFLMFIDSH